jgi:hypothetical protein
MADKLVSVAGLLGYALLNSVAAQARSHSKLGCVV